ncbi:ribosomal protein, L30 [Halocaridina rubra]|uniref:Large ribosomal subunit protein uL30m n=1 Tax=Halocaridina rubra TaxID=373956 RepID=A0AAN9AGC7_HALRR
MLRQSVQRGSQFIKTVNARSASRLPKDKNPYFWVGGSQTGKKQWWYGEKIESTSEISWSSEEATHPALPDSPLGNIKEYPQKLPDGGIQYFGFKYYPRNPDDVDPPYEPAPLHLVIRLKSLSKRPYWEKDILRKFGLVGKRSDFAIVKNIPENNAYLWRVKHMVRITPLRVPSNLPEYVDPKCCFLKETGEFIYSPHLKVDENRLKEDGDLARTKISRKFVDEHTRKNWQNAWQIKLV